MSRINNVHIVLDSDMQVEAVFTRFSAARTYMQTLDAEREGDGTIATTQLHRETVDQWKDGEPNIDLIKRSDLNTVNIVTQVEVVGDAFTLDTIEALVFRDTAVHLGLLHARETADISGALVDVKLDVPLHRVNADEARAFAEAKLREEEQKRQELVEAQEDEKLADAPELSELTPAHKGALDVAQRIVDNLRSAENLSDGEYEVIIEALLSTSDHISEQLDAVEPVTEQPRVYTAFHDYAGIIALFEDEHVAGGYLNKLRDQVSLIATPLTGESKRELNLVVYMNQEGEPRVEAFSDDDEARTRFHGAMRDPAPEYENVFLLFGVPVTTDPDDAERGVQFVDREFALGNNDRLFKWIERGSDA